MNVLILSDIHGNLEALESVLTCSGIRYDSVIFLGDLIDYGPHSNEVAALMESLKQRVPFLCNLRGNHEDSIINNDYGRFSSERGRQCARYTRRNLSKKTWDYIQRVMEGTGLSKFSIDGKKCLAVHGSLEDIYWKAIKPRDDLGQNHRWEEYRGYDYVFSGHSHIPHFFEVFFPVENPLYRNKKKTVFINLGSVGQPRNHSPLAQFSVLDTETGAVRMGRVVYDVKKERLAFSDDIDLFYQERLGIGV